MTAIETIGIVGAGVMGRGAAQLFAQKGYRIRLFDRQDGIADAAREIALKHIARAAEKGRVAEDVAAIASDRLTVEETLNEFADCDLVIEAIVEKVQPKQALFAELESIVGEECILATNTSSLSVAEILGVLKHPERGAGLHFFNPVPLMRIAEIIRGPHTSETVMKSLFALIAEAGHAAIEAKDYPGFLINHAGRAFSTEGLTIIEEGVCSPDALDGILKETLGFRMGPCELLDLTGLDVSVPVMEQIYEGFYEDPRLRPPAIGKARLRAGQLGRKAGAGFYRYDDNGGRFDAPKELLCEQKSSRVSFELACDVRFKEALADLIIEKGGSIVESGGDIVVVAPLGRDVTDECITRGLDTASVIGIDAWLGLNDAPALFATPATTRRAISIAQGFFSTPKKRAEVCADSVGLVAQRILVLIVNLACDIAQKRIARPRDIDKAVKIALGYPKGPLEWGDEAGRDLILEVSSNLFTLTGDPRYRPSPWLRRRAQVDLSLLSEDL